MEYSTLYWTRTENRIGTHLLRLDNEVIICSQEWFFGCCVQGIGLGHVAGGSNVPVLTHVNTPLYITEEHRLVHPIPIGSHQRVRVLINVIVLERALF